MTQFATNADLAARLGLAFSSAEQTRADSRLTLASGLIQEETKQTIALVTGETYTRPGDYSERVRLPQRPVVLVASVTLNGVALTTDSFYVDGDELVRLNWNAVMDSSFGLPFAGWGFPWWDLVVVYTHGYAAIPTLVKTICMEMVTRVWVNPGSVIQEVVAGTEVSYAPYAAPPRGLLLTDAEKNDLRKMLVRHTTSLALR